MKQLGRTLTLSPGLLSTLRVKIFEGQIAPPDFADLEFRAGILGAENAIVALQVTPDTATASIVVSVTPAVIDALPEKTEIGILFKRGGESASAQGVGYIPVQVVDRGHRWS